MKLNHYSIKRRISVGIVAVICLAIAIIVPFLMNRIENVIEQAEYRELQALQQSFTAKVDAEARQSTTMSELVAGVPEVQAAVADQARDRLAALFVPGFQTLKEQGVMQFQFHLPPATSLLRVHNPDTFGDDLSELRPTIVETNRTQQPVSGVDQGMAGLGIRGLAPIFHQGDHVGSLEFGMSLGQRFFEEFAEQYGVEAGLHLRQNNRFTPFASTLKEGQLLSASAIQATFNGESDLSYATYEGVPFAVLGHVLLCRYAYWCR
nr:cache domain-containing protein [uncultured Halomonas sp.]